MDDLALGRSLRVIRIRRGLRQADVAEAARVSRATVSRVELGQLDALQLATIRRVCRAVGLRLVLGARGQGAELDRVLGARHGAMHEAVGRLFSELPQWTVAHEVTFAVFAERGAIDILAWHARTRSLLVIELKTELVDIQETVGMLDRKVRLAAKVAAERGWHPATISAWLVVAEGSTNRRRVAEHATMLRAVLPSDGRAIGGWLREPAGRFMGLSFLSDDRPGSAPSAFSAVTRVPTRGSGRSGALCSPDARRQSTRSSRTGQTRAKARPESV